MGYFAYLVFGTKKDALAFKKLESIGGHTTVFLLEEAVNSNGIACSLKTNIVADEWLVDVSQSQKNPVKKDEDSWYVDLVEYVKPPKRKVAIA